LEKKEEMKRRNEKQKERRGEEWMFDFFWKFFEYFWKLIFFLILEVFFLSCFLKKERKMTVE